MAILQNHSHESYERKETLKVGSDKKFGYTFAIIFFFLTVSPFLFHANTRVVFVVLGFIFEIGRAHV